MAYLCSRLIGLILLILMALIFCPLLFVGRLLRAAGTLLCNLAFKVLGGIEWLGEQAAAHLPS